MSGNLSLTIRNDVSELPRLFQAAEPFMEENRLSPGCRYAALLALEEMITNIIKYGYDDRGAHEIAVSLCAGGGNLRIRLEDDGHEFDPVAAPDPEKGKPLHEMKIGGLGIHLVRSMVDEIVYRRDRGRNLLDIRISADKA